MKFFLRVLAALYFVGALLHLADILNLRMHFSEMNLVWRCWTIYLASFDLLAAIGMWQIRRWGIVLFVVIAVSQLIAYGLFRDTFPKQNALIVFHVVSLAAFTALSKIRTQKT